MKNLNSLIIVFLLFIVNSALSAETYLSESQLLKIGSGSLGLAVIGYISENSVSESRNSLINGPILFDSYFQEHIGGDLSTRTPKTNFLDNSTGAVITPAIGITFLLLTDYSHYGHNRNKQLFQDAYLFTSGLIATSGIGGLFKGLVARERPYYHEQKQIPRVFDSEDKLSFFSGHTSLAFYSMHYLNRRLSNIMSEKQIPKKWRLAKSFSCYGLASFVAVSRIHASKHYASDVIVGAGVGVLISELFYNFGEKKFTNISIKSTNSHLIFSYQF